MRQPLLEFGGAEHMEVGDVVIAAPDARGAPFAAAAAVTSGRYMDNEAPRYTRLHSRVSMGITEPKGGPR